MKSWGVATAGSRRGLWSGLVSDGSLRSSTTGRPRIPAQSVELARQIGGVGACFRGEWIGPPVEQGRAMHGEPGKVDAQRGAQSPVLVAPQGATDAGRNAKRRSEHQARRRSRGLSTPPTLVETQVQSRAEVAQHEALVRGPQGRPQVGAVS